MFATFTKMDKEQAFLRKQVLKASWILRGGATVNELYQMSLKDLGEIMDLAKENYDITKKINMPHF